MLQKLINEMKKWNNTQHDISNYHSYTQWFFFNIITYTDALKIQSETVSPINMADA